MYLESSRALKPWQRRRLTLVKLAQYDDILTNTLVDRVSDMFPRKALILSGVDILDVPRLSDPEDFYTIRAHSQVRR